MLEIDVFTLFPHWFAWLSEEPSVQRALNGPLSLRFLSYRDYSPLPHAQVDDAPFGGGAGMLMRVDAVASAVEGAYGGDLESVRAERRIVALDPGGRRLDDAYARELAGYDRLTLLCGRYEGFDARVLEHVATESLSLGPFVLSGGEPVAMAVVDALARLLPGRWRTTARARRSRSRRRSTARSSTRTTRGPAEWRGHGVPEVLLSGHHARIDAWRREQAVARRADGRGR